MRGGTTADLIKISRNTYIGVASPGDLLFYSGDSPVSRTIQYAQRILGLPGWEWNHVEQVAPIHGELALRAWGSDWPQGVAPKPLRERVRSKDRVAVRRRARGDDEHESRYETELSKAWAEIAGRPYERDPRELLRSLWDTGEDDVGDRLERLFCSEAVALVLARVGALVGGETAPDTWSPAELLWWRTSAYGAPLELRSDE